jgi:hypothetical protein
MNHAKKLLGLALLLMPFIGVAVICVITGGVQLLVSTFGIVAVTLLLVWGGLMLLEE